MKEFTLPSGCVLLAHDSPRTLPESRRTEHDYYALVASGIGSNMNDIDRHFETMIGLIGSDDQDAQMNAINNTRFLFANLLEKQQSPAQLAFCCLVESIDGQAWTDYTPEGVEQLSRELASRGLNETLLQSWWAELRKKSTGN
ncbi:hypothetical protein [Spirosoma sordidisoli]|uniref:Uncharacterized protein n=1 Tax=Spirosoma sordidisoli TaxID=2502893 RepID=A0A4Q2UPN3_9BACT|nr:hypothetical protein [Spirosoma sordidisoli]RYC70862.1 hypothetical protein EQG79_01540 [Spirosoma sordidisoli]